MLVDLSINCFLSAVLSLLTVASWIFFLSLSLCSYYCSNVVLCSTCWMTPMHDSPTLVTVLSHLGWTMEMVRPAVHSWSRPSFFLKRLDRDCREKPLTLRTLGLARLASFTRPTFPLPPLTLCFVAISVCILVIVGS